MSLLHNKIQNYEKFLLCSGSQIFCVSKKCFVALMLKLDFSC